MTPVAPASEKTGDPHSARPCRCREAFPGTVPAVALENVSFAYGCETAVEDISLMVDQGDFLALIGPNGGGKTTLLRIMLGLLEPQKGAARVFGNPPARMTRNIGYVPQFSTLRPDFPASVLEMVLMGAARPSLVGGSWPGNARSKAAALEHLDTLGLADLASRPVSALSGGQRQRALVARALMGKPAEGDAPFLLLLDEPTASIDPQGKFCFYEFLGKLRGFVSIIVVSHDLFIASPFFNRIAFVNRSLVPLPDNRVSAENLTLLFGRHLHECPVADFQHAEGIMHPEGCSHPACADNMPESPDGGAESADCAAVSQRNAPTELPHA